MSNDRIDREKHDVDVTEHVLDGGVHADTAPDPNIQVTDLDVRVWPLGTVASAVQVQVLPEDEDDPQ